MQDAMASYGMRAGSRSKSFMCYLPQPSALANNSDRGFINLYIPYYEHSLSTRLIFSDSVRFVKVLLGQTTTPGTTFPTLCNKCVGSLTSPTN